MEKVIFFIMVFLVVTLVEAFSTKKNDDSQRQDEWDVSEFDFSKVKSAPKVDELKILNDIKTDKGDAGKEVSTSDGYERSIENERYFEGKSTYIEQSVVQADTYINQSTVQADTYISSASDESHFPVPGVTDAYALNTGGQIVKSKKDGEKHHKKIAVDTDSNASLILLENAAAGGQIIDRKTESLNSERREAKMARKALKKMDSSIKSGSGVMPVAGVNLESQNAEINEQFDVASMFSGNNIKKTILASIILDKTKF